MADAKQGGRARRDLTHKIEADVQKKCADMRVFEENAPDKDCEKFILLAMGLKAEELPPFAEPEHWLQYFPPLGVRDLQRFGCPTDFRRSFITTELNPFCDKFIRWQFGKLKKGASDELGHPPSPRGDLPDGGDWEGDHLRAAAGHMRAAGLRL